MANVQIQKNKVEFTRDAQYLQHERWRFWGLESMPSDRPKLVNGLRPEASCFLMPATRPLLFVRLIIISVPLCPHTPRRSPRSPLFHLYPLKFASLPAQIIQRASDLSVAQKCDFAATVVPKTHLPFTIFATAPFQGDGLQRGKEGSLSEVKNSGEGAEVICAPDARGFEGED